MDENPEDKRLENLTEQMLISYGVIHALLAGLPIPVMISPFDEEWDGIKATLQLSRVFTILEDQPLTVPHRAMVKNVVLDWITVYEIGEFIKMAGQTPWRLDAMDYALKRMMAFMTVVSSALGINLFPED